MPYRNDDLDLDATIRRAANVATTIGSLQLVLGGVLAVVMATAESEIDVGDLLSTLVYVAMGALVLVLGLLQRREATRTSARFTVLMGIFGAALASTAVAFVARIVTGEGTSGLTGPVVLGFALYATQQGRASLRQLEEEAAAA